MKDLASKCFLHDRLLYAVNGVCACMLCVQRPKGEIQNAPLCEQVLSAAER